jgi:hypothetical protein
MSLGGIHCYKCVIKQVVLVKWGSKYMKHYWSDGSRWSWSNFNSCYSHLHSQPHGNNHLDLKELMIPNKHVCECDMDMIIHIDDCNNDYCIFCETFFFKKHGTYTRRPQQKQVALSCCKKIHNYWKII